MDRMTGGFRGAHGYGQAAALNDMHLGHQMPNLWYEAQLHAGTLNVAGVTLPGMPYVIVGHNQRIAWGFTNVGPTVTDVSLKTSTRRARIRLRVDGCSRTIASRSFT